MPKTQKKRKLEAPVPQALPELPTEIWHKIFGHSSFTNRFDLEQLSNLRLVSKAVAQDLECKIFFSGIWKIFRVVKERRDAANENSFSPLVVEGLIGRRSGDCLVQMIIFKVLERMDAVDDPWGKRGGVGVAQACLGAVRDGLLVAGEDIRGY
jgi:hypothetical protein